MADVSSHRLNRWLRAEKAFGLNEVRIGLRDAFSSEAGPAPTPAERNPDSSAGDLSLTVPPSPKRDVPTAANFSVDASLLTAPAELKPMPAVEMKPSEKLEALGLLDRQSVSGCTRCALSKTRRHTVFGEGNPDAKLVFVGEGPGATEDQTGRPFVGRAGQKLDEMIAAMGLTRQQVYICNIVKCRAFVAMPAPKDRPPLPEEVSACSPFLHRQIEIIRPALMVTLGLSASQNLLGVKTSMSRMRGNWHAWRGIPVMPTFHPSYILRNYTPETRRAVWEDLKQVMNRLKSIAPNSGLASASQRAG